MRYRRRTDYDLNGRPKTNMNGVINYLTVVDVTAAPSGAFSITNQLACRRVTTSRVTILLQSPV